MAKIVIIILLSLLCSAGIIALFTFGNGTNFSEKARSFIILENQTDQKSVMAILEKEHIISNNFAFSTLSSQMNIWGKIKPGKYEIRKGQSIWSIIRQLKNGRSAEVNLVINKVRTKEDLAKLRLFLQKQPKHKEIFHWHIHRVLRCPVWKYMPTRKVFTSIQPKEI